MQHNLLCRFECNECSSEVFTRKGEEPEFCPFCDTADSLEMGELYEILFVDGEDEEDE